METRVFFSFLKPWRNGTCRARSRRGQALLNSMIIATIFAMVFGALISLAGNADRLSMRRLRSEQAFQLASAGADMAVAHFKTDRNWMLDGAVKEWQINDPEGGGKIKLQAAYLPNPIAGAPSPICRVTSTGTVQSGMVGPVTRVVEVTLGAGSSFPPVFLKAMVSKSDIELKGRVWTSSEPKSSPSAVGEGDIWANRHIKFKRIHSLMNVLYDVVTGLGLPTLGIIRKRTGDYNIDGDADAGTAIYGNTSGVRGQVRTGANPISFPQVDDAWIASRVGTVKNLPPVVLGQYATKVRLGSKEGILGSLIGTVGTVVGIITGGLPANAGTDDVLKAGTWVYPGEENGPLNGKFYKLQVVIGKRGCIIPDGAVVHIKGDLVVCGPIRGRGTIITEGRITMDCKEYLSFTSVERLLETTLTTTLGLLGARWQMNQEWMKQKVLFISRSGLKGKRKWLVGEVLDTVLRRRDLAIQIKGGARYMDVRGIFYAPNGRIRASGRPTIHGSLVGNFIRADRDVKVVVDRSFDPGPVPPWVEVLSWEER